MPIITNLEERLMQAVRTMYRKVDKNIMAITQRALYRSVDALNQALVEYLETSYPLDTASTWVLDQHWGPKFNVPRNGLNDPGYRLFIKAQVLLILSAGRPDEILKILRLLLPAASAITWTPFYPKAWKVSLFGVPITDETVVTINSAATGNYTITVDDQEATFAAVVPPDNTTTIANGLGTAVTGLGLSVLVVAGPGPNEFTIKTLGATIVVVEVVSGDISTTFTQGAALPLKFLSTKPSPQGGGFATAGENGIGVAWDQNVLSFSSVHGVVPITGFFSSVHGASGGLEAGYAHAVQF